jgi:PadR family transcriptional regulator PadR
MSEPERITKPLLAILAELMEGGEMHGWQIAKSTGRHGPTVYRVLERLNDAGWLTARWEDDTPPGTPRRRYYRLTEQGMERARELLTERGM